MSVVKYDVVVVGSGPNGLAAAVALQQAGIAVLLVEGKEQVGGGLRTRELTLPGFQHDVCSAIHPMAINSPFFSTLPLEAHGLEYLHSPLAVAHPLDGGGASFLASSLQQTAAALGSDAQAYTDLVAPVVEDWPNLLHDFLGPLRYPQNLKAFVQFGLKAVQPASSIVKRFKTPEARGLWAGLAAHSILPLDAWATAAIGMILAAAAHVKGWPLPKGGSQRIADALTSYFESIGGRVQTGQFIESLEQLHAASAYIFDVSPQQLLRIAGHRFTRGYRRQLERYRYGMGVFKVDWALQEAIPFTAEACRRAATVHIGGTFEQISLSEHQSAQNHMAKAPFVLLAQQSRFDATRAPQGQHTAWAYCHVPNGSIRDMTLLIEDQVERVAPGFKDIILAKTTMNTQELEQYNPNYIGGDINGGAMSLLQLFTRPSIDLTPYRTSDKQIFICSASTPPGGGVHGMCGFHAAKTVLKAVFNKKINL